METARIKPRSATLQLDVLPLRSTMPSRPRKTKACVLMKFDRTDSARLEKTSAIRRGVLPPEAIGRDNDPT